MPDNTKLEMNKPIEPTPPTPTWKLTLEEVEGELTFELEGECPSYFELYGLMIHLALNDLQKAYEDAQGP